MGSETRNLSPFSSLAFHLIDQEARFLVSFVGRRASVIDVFRVRYLLKGNFWLAFCFEQGDFFISLAF